MTINIVDDNELEQFLSDIQKHIDPEILQMKDKHGDINEFINSVTCDDDTYYFLNVFKNKRDLSYTRGSIFKAMSICSKHSFLLKKPFDNLLDQALNEYFDMFNPEDSDTVSLQK